MPGLKQWNPSQADAYMNTQLPSLTHSQPPLLGLTFQSHQPCSFQLPLIAEKHRHGSSKVSKHYNCPIRLQRSRDNLVAEVLLGPVFQKHFSSKVFLHR